MDSFGEKAVGLQRTDDRERANRVVCDLSDIESVRKVSSQLGEYAITHLVHTAAVTPWSQNPDFSLDEKMAGSVAWLCNELDIPQLISISGWNVYDMTSGGAPFSEQTPIKPVGDYGASKYKVEERLNDAVTASQVLHLRLASVYGAGQTSAGLIPNLVHAALTNQKITINSLATKRDYLYVSDLMQVVADIAAMQESISEPVLNIGSGRSVSVAEVAETIQDVCRAEYGIDVIIEKPEDPQESTPVDNQLAINKAQGYGLLSDVISFRAGMETYIKWRKNA